MKKYHNKIAILLILFVFAGCDESVLDLQNPETYGTDNYFLTPSEIESSVNAVYAGLYFRGIINHEGFQTIDGMGGEIDAGPSSAGERDVLAMINYSHNNSNPVVEEMWKGYYRIVLRSNLVFDVVDRYVEKNGTSDIMARYKGEAYFLRAWSYFQLVFNWGRVPLRDKYDQSGNVDAPRASEAEIWSLIESDLKKATESLPVSYESKDLGRATRGAAVALLGKVYLYQKKWAEASAEFAKLDQAPYKYSLLPGNKWTNNFGEDPATENNEESIFEVQFSWFSGNFPWSPFMNEGNEVSDSHVSTQTTRPQLYGFNDWRNWKFSTLRANEFKYKNESGSLIVDPRAALTFYGTDDLGDLNWCDNCPNTAPKNFDFVGNGGYWYKKYNNYEYKKSENNLQSGNNDRLIRFADVLLMWAEAKLNLNDVDGCIALINRVRSRIGAFEYTPGLYNKVSAFELLKHERVLELIGEHHRFNDLRRWGIAKEVLNDELFLRIGQRNFLDKHYLLPIPLGERDRNPGLADDVKDDWN